MSSLENADTLELLDRYKFLIKKYSELALELSVKLDKFGKYRNELQLLTVEFSKRGVTAEDPESLKKIIEQELEKRKNGITQTDNTERNT